MMRKRIERYIRISSIAASFICIFVFLIFSVYVLNAEMYTIIALCILFCLLSLPVSFALARLFSQKIVEPIINFDIKNLSESEIYSELKPIVSYALKLERTVENQRSDAWMRQEEYKTLTDNMSEGILIIGRDMKPIMCNHVAMKLLEYKDTSENDPRNLIMRSVKSAFEGCHVEDRIRHEGRNYHLTANPVLQNGSVVGVAVIIIDETQIVASDQMRREFTANVSHELKTPLTSISGFAELMANGMVAPDDISDFSENIYNEAQRLITLVNDIIKLSEIEDDTRLYETSEVDLLVIANDVKQRLSGAAARRNVSIDVQGESVKICGVEQILFEMVRNLCDNAIKYNIEGGNVTLCVEKNADNAVFTVSDTGIGISPEHQGRIFERFYRVDKSHSKEIGGTGLGLSIVKHGAEVHDAEIEIESASGKGTKISLIFKL